MVNRGRHWDEFYEKDKPELTATAFAAFVGPQLRVGGRLLEIGAGNGRDAVFFEALGLQVIALDSSEEAVHRFRRDFPKSAVQYTRATARSFSEHPPGKFDFIYCRFVLHAMPLEDEIETLGAAFDLLESGGIFWAEARSVRDPLINLGEKLGPNETWYGHYRRFIDPEELVQRLWGSGFELEDVEEGDGFAVYAGENPVVVRVKARKP